MGNSCPILAIAYPTEPQCQLCNYDECAWYDEEEGRCGVLKNVK